MKRGWQAAAACFFVLFALAAAHAASLPLLDALGPGPGFFPLCLSLLGMALAVTVAVQVSRGDAALFGGAVELPDRPALARIVAVLVLMAVAASLLDWLGYRLVALGFCAILLPLVGARNPLVIGAFAAIASFGVFHVFYHWLKVPLPIGEFGF
jgi:putative tricarboxylic transport membrane protein